MSHFRLRLTVGLQLAVRFFAGSAYSGAFNCAVLLRLHRSAYGCFGCFGRRDLEVAGHGVTFKVHKLGKVTRKFGRLDMSRS